MAAAASSTSASGAPAIDKEVMDLLAGLNNEDKTAPAANVKADLENMLADVPEATQEEVEAADKTEKPAEKKVAERKKPEKAKPASPEKKKAKRVETPPKKKSAATVASKKAGAAKEMREKVSEVLELREKIKEATRKKKLTEEDVAEGLRRELAAIESGKRPERQAKGISKLKLQEQTARERIYDLDPKNKVPSDGYLDGDGGAETEEEDEEYVAGEEEGDEEEEEKEEDDKDEGEGEDGDDEEEEKLAKKLAPKKKKAKVAEEEEDEEPKPRKRSVSIDSDGAPMAELVDDDEEEDGVVLDDDDDDDDPEADMESVEDVSKFGVSDFLDIAASVKKRGTKRKAPKTKTPEEIKLEEAIQAECEWPTSKLEPEGIVHRGELFVDHDPKVHDWRTKATYKQLSIQLRVEDGKPIWDFGILYTDDEGEEQFAPLRATKDWGNKGIDMAAVRRSKNQRKVGARILPIVSTSKMANYVRAQLNKQKNTKPRVRANGVARLNAPQPPATGTLTLEDAFAAKGKAKPKAKPKEAPVVNKGKREATTDLSTVSVLEGKMVQLAKLIIKNPGARTSMVEKIHEWDSVLLAGFKDAERDPLHVMQDALFPTRNEEVDPSNAEAVKLSAKFKAAARLAVMFVCAYNVECRRIILGIPDKKPEEELSALDKLFV